MIDYAVHSEAFLDNESSLPFDSVFDHFNPDQPKLRHILYNVYEDFTRFAETHKVRPVVIKEMQKAMICDSFDLGFDLYACPQCDEEYLFFHKCRSRLCPSCGKKLQMMIEANVDSISVNTEHRHIVFTIPDVYRDLFRADRELLNLLFIAARNTIAITVNKHLFKQIKADYGVFNKNDYDYTYVLRNYPEAKVFGMIATLHTFGRDLKWNPHIHAIVPEAVYNPVKGSVEKFYYFNYSFLRKTWMYEINRLMDNYLTACPLPGINFRRDYRNPSYDRQIKGYYVYAKKNSQFEVEDFNSCGKADETKAKENEQNIDGVIKYMIRYAARPAMAESRLLKLDAERKIVTWYYDDHKTGDRITVEEPSLELVKKLILHVPDENFKMVRYYGFYHPKQSDILDILQQHFGGKDKLKKTKEGRKKRKKKNRNRKKFRTVSIDTYNRDPMKCKCGAYLAYQTSWVNPDRNKPFFADRCIRKNIAVKKENDQRRARILRENQQRKQKQCHPRL